ncbi:MAG TPA: nucleoside 2-deoxyribosyltransferase [Thermoleophilaceae bacterium]|nr:nucleoside 2-deoxyribosyltransferase [Thermoleophilaceae bacterium]
MLHPPCYIASPLGFTEAGRHYYAQVYLPALRTVVEPIDPWALTSEAEVHEAAAAGREREMALEIGRRNANGIRRAALLAAFLEGQEPDAGTVAEVGYAAALGIPCFGLRSDFRQSGENGAAVNLQVESFIVESGGAILATLDELVTALGAASEELRQKTLAAAESPSPLL